MLCAHSCTDWMCVNLQLHVCTLVSLQAHKWSTCVNVCVTSLSHAKQGQGSACLVCALTCTCACVPVGAGGRGAVNPPSALIMFTGHWFCQCSSRGCDGLLQVLLDNLQLMCPGHAARPFAGVAGEVQGEEPCRGQGRQRVPHHNAQVLLQPAGRGRDASR